VHLRLPRLTEEVELLARRVDEHLKKMASHGTEHAAEGSDDYRQLLQQISDTCTRGRVQAVQAVNAQLIQTYWQVGRHIVEFEQAGRIRAEYGTALIQTLATDLGLRHGKGFSRSNLVYMRLLYLRYAAGAPISQKLSHQLSWSHYVELLRVPERGRERPVGRDAYSLTGASGNSFGFASPGASGKCRRSSASTAPSA